MKTKLSNCSLEDCPYHYRQRSEVSTLVNLHGLTRELRLPREWLRSEADAGRIPCLRVGRRMLFCVQAVRTALARRAAGIPSANPPDTVNPGSIGVHVP
jgi:hypothetical protein